MRTGKGRAKFPKPEGKWLPPGDLTIIGEYTDIGKGETYVIVEGERLPPWVKGNDPWIFKDVRQMLAYREGNHG